MENRQCHNLYEIFTKLKCIKVFFQIIQSSGNSQTHCWILILTTGIYGVMRGAAALWADGSVSCVSVQAKGDA